MDIRNSMDGLKTLLGVPSTPAATSQPATNVAGTAAKPLTGDQATFSSAGAEIQQTAADAGIRTDKVASVQAALAAGSYHVAASAVATKVVDSMLNGGLTPIA